MLRIAPAHVNTPGIPDGIDLRQHLCDALVPALLAHLFERFCAYVVLVRLLSLERMMRQLEVRDVLAIDVERTAHARPEGEDHLEALALDDAEALHAGVVEHARRALQAALER